MPVEFTFVPQGHEAETASSASGAFFFDPAAGVTLSRAAAAGFHQVLIDDRAEVLGNIDLAGTACRLAHPLGVVLTHWAGALSPVVAANTLAELAAKLGGNLSLRILGDGGEEGEADEAAPLRHAAAWQRTDEYLTLLRQLWSNASPIDHEGRFYSVQGGALDKRIAQPLDMPIRMSGLSGTALHVAGRHADMFELSAGSITESKLLIERVREAGARHGRAGKIGFALRIHVSDRKLVAEQGSQAAAGRSALSLLPYIDAGVSEFMVSGLSGEASFERFSQWIAPLQRSWRPERPAKSSTTLLSAVRLRL